MKGLLLTYAVVLVGGLVSFRQPTIGLAIYVGLSVLRPEALWGWAGGFLFVSRIAVIPGLVGWMLQGFGSWRFGQARAIVICLLLYFAWLIMSSSQAVEPEAAWWTVLEFSKTLLPLLLGMTMVRTEKEVRRLLWVIVLMQGFVSLDMNEEYLGGYNRAHEDGYGGMDNNCFGISLLSTFGGALGLFLSSKQKIAKAVAAVATLLILHTILLTFSRGAFVGLLGVGVMAFIMLPKKPKYIGIILLAGIIALRLTGPELSARLATTFASHEDRDGTAQSRLDLWRDCFTVIAAQPFFGVGPTGWGTVAKDFGWPEGKEAHSLWIQTAAELGIPGALFLILFYILTIKRLWPIARGRSPNIDSGTALFATGIILGIIGFAGSAQFVTLVGLEPPLWMAMLGALLLKIRSVPELAPEQTLEAGKVITPRPGAAPVPTRPSLNPTMLSADQPARPAVLQPSRRVAPRGTFPG